MLTPSDRLHLQQIQKQFADVGWINREDLIWLMDTLAQVCETDKNPPTVSGLLEFVRIAPDWIPDDE